MADGVSKNLWCLLLALSAAVFLTTAFFLHAHGAAGNEDGKYTGCIAAGDTRGNVHYLDLRMMLSIGVYKGFAGGVRAMQVAEGSSDAAKAKCSGPTLVSVGVDRCLRLHHAETRSVLLASYYFYSFLTVQNKRRYI